MKLKETKKYILFVFIGIVLVFLARWKLFLTRGVIGHNWDWNIPFLREQSKFIFSSLFFDWIERAFSYQAPPRIQNFFLYSLGSLTNGEVQTKAILFLVPFLSLVNSAILLNFLLKRFLGKEDLPAVFFGSITYAFAPSVFNDLVGGQLAYLIGYPFIPLFIYFVFKIFEEKAYARYFFPIAMISFVLAGSHNWNFGLGLLLTIFLFLYRKQLKKFLLTTAVFFLSTAFNLIFAIFGIRNINEVMPEELNNINVFTYLGALKNLKQTIDKVFVGAGYGDRNLFENFLESYQPIFFFLSYLIVILVLGNLLLQTKSIKNNKLLKLLLWALFIFLLGLFMVTAGRDPLGSVFIFLMRKIVYFRAFRTVFHFFVLRNFAFSILAAVSLFLANKYNVVIRHKNIKIVSISVICVFLLANLPVFTEGDNGWKRLKEQKRDSLDVYKINSSYLNILKLQFADPEWYRVFIIPPTTSPVYRETPYQRWGQGGDPETTCSPKPIFVDDIFTNSVSHKIFKFVEKNVVDNEPLNQKLLGFLSVKKIIRRRDIGASFSSWAGRYNDQAIDEKLSRLPPVLNSQYIDYYDLESSYFVPHFYVPKNPFYFSGEIETMMELVSSSDYDIRSAIFSSALASDNFSEYVINAVLAGVVKDGELVNFQNPLGVELSSPSLKPGSFLYSFALDREKNDLKALENFPKELLEKYIFYANKRIAEILNYSFFVNKTKEGRNALISYQNNMEKAIDVIERIKKADAKNFPDIYSRMKGILWWQNGQFRKLSQDKEGLDQVNRTFSELSKRMDKLQIEHDFSKFVYKFNIPRNGEYEMYVKGGVDTRNQMLDIGGTETGEDIGYQKLDIGDTNIQYPVSSFINENWKSFETKYFPEGEQEYILPNEFYGKNFLRDNLKIDNYTPNTVYKISFRYKASLDDSVGQPYFSINESKAGKLFDKMLLYTGDDLEYFEALFRSSEWADRAFVFFSVSEYEDLRVEKIEQPKLLLRLKDTGENTEYRILNIDQNTEYKILNTEDKIPKIAFSKVNPTKYRVKIEGASKPYTLVFSESFNNGWKIYLNNKNTEYKILNTGYWILRRIGERVTGVFLKNQGYEKEIASYFDGQVSEGTSRMNFLEPATFETWNRKPIVEDRHFMANGYVNSWKINPEDVGNAENYEIIVEFEPQRIYYLGLFTSFLTIGGTFILMIITIIRERKRNIEY